MNFKNSILITAIGSFSSRCVVDSLKLNFSNTKIIGCDIYPAEWHAVSTKYDNVYQVPEINKSYNYLNKILAICLEENIKYIIPLTDLEIDYFNFHRKEFLKKGIILCMPTQDVLNIVRNKYNLYNYFRMDTYVPSIKTYKSGLTQNVVLPVIGKPVKGRSSEGIIFAKDELELKIINNKSGYIIQEIIEGSVFTVDYIRNSFDNTDFCVARKELLRTKNGAGITVEIRENSQLKTMVSHIGKRLNINGCVNMEFIQKNNVYYLIDINPRFSAGIAFTQLAGYDMVSSHINCFSGKQIYPPISISNFIATKTMSETITKEGYE